METGTDTALVLDDVQRAASEYTSTSGVKVSLPAQELIAAILGSFLFDPHPSWNAERGAVHTGHFNNYIRRLPDFLKEIGEQPSVQNEEITSFDVIYWMRDHLAGICTYLCPFC